jgi:hypothetical protein
MPIKVEVEFKTIGEFRKEFKKLKKVRRDYLVEQTDLVMAHAVKKSKLNAPILTGDLRASIKYEKARATTDGVITSGIGSDLPYALRWHEEEFELGPVSAQQPSTPEGGVGNKYITRALMHRKREYEKLFLRGLLSSMLEKKVKTIKPRIH